MRKKAAPEHAEHDYQPTDEGDLACECGARVWPDGSDKGLPHPDERAAASVE